MPRNARRLDSRGSKSFLFFSLHWPPLLFSRHSGLELIVQNLSRLDESNEEDAQGVHSSLGCIENLVEVRPNVAVLVCERTHMLKFLLLRLKVMAAYCDITLLCMWCTTVLVCESWCILQYLSPRLWVIIISSLLGSCWKINTCRVFFIFALFVELPFVTCNCGHEWTLHCIHLNFQYLSSKCILRLTKEFYSNQLLQGPANPQSSSPLSRQSSLLILSSLCSYYLQQSFQVKKFDANKLYCSEVLSILLQAHESNQRRICNLQGGSHLLLPICLFISLFYLSVNLFICFLLICLSIFRVSVFRYVMTLLCLFGVGDMGLRHHHLDTISFWFPFIRTISFWFPLIRTISFSSPLIRMLLILRVGRHGVSVAGGLSVP